ncbi:MAG: tRNA (adenosine(37)-N6)-threonylcarbamoyltransferase complex dimerization subunit type 1 TsaB [Erysipelotrichaceae bacterium]|nr:tRNA (adenosine(37)-N6)-threonylcarbamoyltransferase complex dimerization subunit type 1 TsaB [Erysipelotrichaceae bacterium]
MITLCMDTSHKLLVVALLKDNEVLASTQMVCFKRQSEELFPQIEALMQHCELTPDDIGEVVITKGPGSYTGVRIAMCVAKVLCSTKHIPLYSLSTLQLYAGVKDKTCVLLDARGKRAYVGFYDKGIKVKEDSVDYVEVIKNELEGYDLVGDISLVSDKEDTYPNVGECFLALKDMWKLEENVHAVVPEYLKDAEAYKVGKHA